MDAKTANDIANKTQINKINNMIENAANDGHYSVNIKFIEKPNSIYIHFAELGFRTQWLTIGCKFGLVISWGENHEILEDTNEDIYEENCDKSDTLIYDCTPKPRKRYLK